MYFIDPSLFKNRPYYSSKLQSLKDELGIDLHLFYNGELFEFLTGKTDAWEMLQSALIAWRDSGLPSELDFDCDAKDIATELLLSVRPLTWYKVIANDRLWESGVIDIIFPSGTTLHRLSLELAVKGSTKFSLGKQRMSFIDFAKLIRERLRSHYALDYDLPI